MREAYGMLLLAVGLVCSIVGLGWCLIALVCAGGLIPLTVLLVGVFLFVTGGLLSES